MRRHRSRAQRRQRYNVVGFAQPPLGLRDSASEDESTDEDEDEGARFGRDAAEPSSSFMASSTFITDDTPSFDRLDKMSKELDGLVRFLRRGVESLAGGTGDAAQAFGVLAFALEDWDT
jgi:gamma-tubulin complex component 5